MKAKNMNKGVSRYLRNIEGSNEVDAEVRQKVAAAISTGCLGEAVDRGQHWIAEAWPAIGPLVCAFAHVAPTRAIGVLLLLTEACGLEAVATALCHAQLMWAAWPWLAARVFVQATHEGDFDSSAHRVAWLLYRVVREEANERAVWEAFGSTLAGLLEAETDQEIFRQMGEGEEVDEGFARRRVLAAAVVRLVASFEGAAKRSASDEPGLCAGLALLLPEGVDPAGGLPVILAGLQEAARAERAAAELPAVLEGEAFDAHAASPGEYAAHLRAPEAVS